MGVFATALRMSRMATPSGTVPATEGLLYLKSDGKLYKKIGAVETLVESSSSALANIAARQTTAQGFIGTDGWKQLTNWTADYAGSGVTLSGAAGTFTVAAAGYYTLTLRVGYSSGPVVNSYGSSIWVNGTRVATNLQHAAVAANLTAEVSRDVLLAANDVVTFRGLVGSTSNINTAITDGYTVSSIRRFA